MLCQRKKSVLWWLLAFHIPPSKVVLNWTLSMKVWFWKGVFLGNWDFLKGDISIATGRDCFLLYVFHSDRISLKRIKTITEWARIQTDIFSTQILANQQKHLKTINVSGVNFFFQQTPPHVSCSVFFFKVGLPCVFLGKLGEARGNPPGATVRIQVAYETGYYSTVFQPRDGGTSVECNGQWWVDNPFPGRVTTRISFFYGGKNIWNSEILELGV